MYESVSIHLFKRLFHLNSTVVNTVTKKGRLGEPTWLPDAEQKMKKGNFGKEHEVLDENHFVTTSTHI